MTDLASLRLGFAFGLGAATFFAPCAFPLLPGYVAYYLGQEGSTPEVDRSVTRRLARAGVVGVLTSVGFFLVYAALAGVVLTAGTRILSGISVLELVVGAVLIVLGLGMASGRFQLSMHVPLPERRRSATGYVAFGIVYAAAAAGCTAPAFIAIASLAVSGGPATTVLTMGTYAAGMSALMITVTGLSALGRDTILRRLSANTGRITRLAGVVLVVAGVVQVYYFLFVFDGLRTLGLA